MSPRRPASRRLTASTARGWRGGSGTPSRPALPRAARAVRSDPALPPPAPRPAGAREGTILYLMRHGETVWNCERRFQGRRDSPLTAKGRLQAQRMGEVLRRLGAGAAGWAIVASPLGRALETARIVAETLGRSPD